MKTILIFIKKIPTPLILFGFFSLAMGLRLMYYREVKDGLLFQTLIFDAKYYDQWARQIVSQGWLGKGIFFVSPLYAYFLAIIYNFCGNPAVVKFIQFGMGSLMPLMLYAIGIRIFNRKIAFISASAACFYGAAVFFESLLLKVGLEVFLSCASLLILLSAKEKDKPWLWVLSGVAMGLSALARETALLLILLVIIWIYYIKGDFAKFLKAFACYAVGVFLIIAPVTLRNIFVGKNFVLITYGGGMNFYMGNFKGADGALKEPDFIRIDPEFEEIDSKIEAERRAGRPLTPSEISSFWFKETIKEILQDRGHFIGLLFRKTGLLFNRTGLSDNYQMDLFKEYSFILRRVLLGFWPIAIFGLSGIFFALFITKQWRQLSIVLIFFFATSSLLMLGHIIDRYREVLVPELILFSAYFFVQLYDTLKARKYSMFASGVIVVLVFTVLTSLHFSNFEQKPLADAHNELGFLYHTRGEYEKAKGEYKLALTIRPNHLWALQNLADIYLRDGDVDAAIEELKKAIEYRYDSLELYVLLEKARRMKGKTKDEIRKELSSDKEFLQKLQLVTIAGTNAPSYSVGLDYLMKNEYDKSIEQFEKILDANPDSVNVLINLGVAYRAKNQPEKAISCYERVLNSIPEMLPARYNLAMTLLSQKRFAETLPHLQQIVSVFPEFLQAQFYLATAYKETGQTKKALEEYRKMISWTMQKNEQRYRYLTAQIRERIWLLEQELQHPQDDKTKELPMDRKRYE